MWGKPLTVTNYPFSHNHGSVEKSPENERKQILEIHPFSTGCHDYMGGYGDILSWELISIIHFEDDDVPNFPVVAELLVDRVGDAHHLIFWPVSDFFLGGWKKLPKGRGGEAVGELFFFLYRHFWDEFLLNYMCFFLLRVVEWVVFMDAMTESICLVMHDLVLSCFISSGGIMHQLIQPRCHLMLKYHVSTMWITKWLGES